LPFGGPGSLPVAASRIRLRAHGNNGALPPRGRVY